MFNPIRVITRPKKLGIGVHFGVHFSNGVVYDYTYEEGFRQVSLGQFSEGMPVIVVREIPWQMAHIVRARLKEVSRNPRKYDLLKWNCETFAVWLTSGVAKSNQITAAIFLVGAVAFIAIAGRSGG